MNQQQKIDTVLEALGDYDAHKAYSGENGIECLTLDQFLQQWEPAELPAKTVKNHTPRLAAYIAGYCETEIERGNAIEAQTIADAIDAFEGGASESGHDYAVQVTCTSTIKLSNVTRIIPMDDKPHPRESEYVEYFDQCEKNNKIALDFTAWLRNNK